MRRNRSKSSLVFRLLWGHPLYWACQVFGWGCIWIIDMLHVLIDPPRLPISYFHSTVFLLSLACFSHFYRVFIQLNDWCQLNWRQLVPRAALASLLIAVVHTLLVKAFFPVHTALTNVSGAVTPGHFFFLTVSGFFLTLAWSGIYFGYHFQVDYQKMQVNQLRMQVALREAEHRTLSAQINPHFLFNSLNTLRSLIDENPEKARDAVTELARLFRASLKTTRKDLITLREELETVQSYLSLEQFRFESRLIIHGHIPTEALDAKLPPFLLQTLIENAIKYGVGPHPQTEISYRARLDTDGLVLQVTNPGQIRIQSPRDSIAGIGLENSRLRLQLLFGAKASLNLKSPQENVVQAEVLIPQLAA